MIMKEIVPDVFTWPWFSERFGYDFNGYLVRHPAGNVVIDPVEPSDEVLAEIVALGAARVAITNRNHFRACARVREATGARIAIHPADAPFLRERGVPVDDELAAGGRVGPLVVEPAPGKSPGEVALHWPERRILFIGDACVGHPPGALGLLSTKVIDDAAELGRSLQRLARELDFDTLLVGDGVPILEGGRPALTALVERLSS
jgi:glyoxylase-like metal-dependent hydrolase (beta-lactamase superfamily II)